VLERRVLKPRNSVLWHRTVLNWLDHWLQGKPAPEYGVPEAKEVAGAPTAK